MFRIRLLLALLLLPLVARAGDLEAITLDGRKVDKAPKMTWWPEPKYPRQLLNMFNYTQGDVVIAVVLDAQGVVTEARVLRAPHPAFIAPSLAALNQVEFTPGMRAGRPVPCIVSLDCNFRNYYRRASDDQPEGPRRPKNPPPEYACDNAPGMTSYCDVVYPRDLLVNQIKGEAEVQWVLDEDGKFESGEVLSATQPEFGAALLAAVENWQFLPGARDGYRTKSMVVFRQRFRPGSDYVSAADDRMAKELRTGGKDIVELAALDHRPHAIYQVAPKYPLADEKQCIAGEAEVEFIISHTGQVVLPQIVSATRPEFGWAAVTAVAQWFYAIPTVKGHPVDVRVRMPLSFDPPKPPAAG